MHENQGNPCKKITIDLYCWIPLRWVLYIINDPCAIWGWDSLTHTIHETGISYQSHGWYGLLFTSFHHHLDSGDAFFWEGTPKLVISIFRNFSSPASVYTSQPQRVSQRDGNLRLNRLQFKVSYNGGTQQPWVFLLKIIIFGVFWGVPTIKETPIYTLR